MTLSRPSPYIHVSWLKKLLVGDTSCEWASWYKAHYKDYPKMPSGFNFANWKVEHTGLLNETRRELEAQGKKVRVEAQNYFQLRGRNNVIVAGTPDLLTLPDDAPTIYDTKTGKPNHSDTAQVMIYMWALPLADPRYKGVKFDGVVKYATHEIPIPNDAIDEKFIARLKELIWRIAGDTPPTRVASAHECGFCEIMLEQCEERFIEEVAAADAEGEVAF